MPDYSQLTQGELLHLVNDFDRRLRALETAPRAGFTTLTSDGGIKILDKNGVRRMTLGATSEGSDVGIWLYDATGTNIVAFFGTDHDQGRIQVFGGADLREVLSVTDLYGFAKPQYTLVAWPEPQHTVDTAGRPTTTSGSFDTLFNIDFVAIAANVSGQVFAAVPGGSTASVQVTIQRAGGGADTQMFLSTGITSNQFISFDVPIPVGALLPGENDVIGLSYRLKVKMARTAGAGTLALGLFEPFSNHI